MTSRLPAWGSPEFIEIFHANDYWIIIQVLKATPDHVIAADNPVSGQSVIMAILSSLRRQVYYPLGLMLVVALLHRGVQIDQDAALQLLGSGIKLAYDQQLVEGLYASGRADTIPPYLQRNILLKGWIILRYPEYWNNLAVDVVQEVQGRRDTITSALGATLSPSLARYILRSV